MPDARGQEFRVLVKTVCHGFTRILADVAFSNFFLSVLIRICGKRVASGAASASKKTMTAEANPSRVQVIHSETRTDASTQLREWLEQLLSRRGSDLLLVPQAPPAIRIEGALEAIGERALSGDEIEAAVVPAMAAHAREEYRLSGIADSSYRVEGVGRFRINLHRERGRAAATVRALPSTIPRIEDLHLPVGVGALAKLRRGLVIIGGATGSGKSTTLAALVNEINRNEARHIVTIEDPIEYEHAHDRSLI